MKKLVSLALAAALSLSLFAGCGGKNASQPTEAPTPSTEAPKANVEGTMEELLNKIVEVNPVEFMGGTMSIDLTDTSEDGLWAIKSYTGLDSAEGLTDAAFFEPMMGSKAFSMVMVRTTEADTKAVAENMKAGIDPRKWICVEANDIKAAGYGDVVMFIMLDNNGGMSAQSFVDAFQKVVGAELDFVI